MTAEVEHPPDAVDSSHPASPTSQPITNNHQILPTNQSMSNGVDQIRSGESPPTMVTVRMVVDSKEVGSIIGKRGDNVKRYREASGAKINISDALSAERIVTITGMLEQIRIAFNLMCIKFEDDLRANTSPGSTLPPVNVKLVIPASQCGSLIGKGGTKIKELRETTGACVAVATDMLPASTERVVTITGGATSISNCVTEVCSIMLESPPKGATIPYRPPKPQMMYGMTTAFGIPGQAPGMPGQAPAIHGQAPLMPGQPGMAMPPHMSAATMTTPVSSHPQMSSSELGYSTVLQAAKLGTPQPSPIFSQAGMTFPSTAAMNNLAGAQAALMSPMAQQGAPLIMNPAVANPSINPYIFMQQGLGIPAMNAMNSYIGAAGPRPFNNQILGAMPVQQQNQSTEMVIPNELIGCIIGRGGAKIQEIRNLSGAQIKISNCEEGTNDRKVTITGFPDTLSLAIHLINTSIQTHKLQLLLASQEQATTANPSQQPPQPSNAATLPTNLSQPSVSQSNQPQLTPNLATAVANTVQLQQLQQLQQTRPLPQVNGQAATYPYGYPSLPSATNGTYPFASPYGLVGACDPKAMLSASKLKIMPKLERRFAPY